MRPTDLNELGRAFPFRPFAIHVHSGENFEVRFRDQFFVQGLHVVYETPDRSEDYWIPIRSIAWIRRGAVEKQA